MKYIIYLLSIGALVGFDYSITQGVSWADIAWGTLFVISLFNLLRRTWKFDYFAKCSALFIPFMLISALLNGEIGNTIFVNFFRNYTAGVVVYFALSNTIQSRKDIKTFLICGLVFLLSFILNYRRMMLDTYYENLATLDFGYGRNNVAFTALLFAILFEFLYYSKLAKGYILLGDVVMAVIIVLCASRYAMIMLIASYIIYRIMSGVKFSGKDVLVVGAFFLLLPFAFNAISGLGDSTFFENSSNYLNEKISNAGDDFYHTRIYLINVEPILKYISNKGVISLVIGDGCSIQHSFFSHALITTGVIGLYVFLRCLVNLLKWSFHFKGEGFSLFVIILTMYLNDFITNARFIIGVNSVFYCALCAIVYKYIQLSNNENIDFSK